MEISNPPSEMVSSRKLERMKRTFFHDAFVLSVESRYVFGHRCADRYAFLIPATTPNTRPPTIPQGVEPKRYVSHTQPNPPPTTSEASSSVPIRTAWPSPRTMDLVKGHVVPTEESAMQPITQGLCRWRARNSSRITVKLSSRLCAITQPKQWGIVSGAYV
jgi:hypothetical protein